ncbi:endonuclease/exonuclease/phosphatase family protein [Plantibacter auratus]|uniref:endonuclease/exonuclease/phosphatase family protein n=1 Tax=Plantibacter auratus TaxID=272914 RepID=UPI003D33A25F
MSESILTQNVLTVMSYNIRTAVAQPGHEWVDRAPLVSQVIARNAPDLLGLQEVREHQLHDLLPGLAEYDWFGQGRDGGSAGEYGPVCFRRSRFEQLDAGEFWLSDTPDEPGSNTWPSLHARFVTWVRLRERRTGDELVFANTHLDHESSPHGDDVRTRSAKLIADRFSGIDVPVLLTGDFNTERGSAAHDSLADAGFVDLSPVESDGIGTFQGYGPQRPGNARIDWVLGRSGSVAPHTRLEPIEALVDEQDPTSEASDHFPILIRAQLTH